jgi:hypothetical protein
MRVTSGPNAGSSALVRARETSALLTDLVPKSSNSASGEWRYRIDGAPGQPPELGRLWLRTKGTLIQGVLETAAGRDEDALTGSLTEGSGVLELVWKSKGGAEQRIRLIPKGPVYSGMFEGTHRKVDLLRPQR